VTAVLGPYAAFIVSAYAAAIAIVAGLIVWIVLDRRRLLRVMQDLETRGATRRSQRVIEKKNELV
jgi:heme exporter protein D